MIRYLPFSVLIIYKDLTFSIAGGVLVNMLHLPSYNSCIRGVITRTTAMQIKKIWPKRTHAFHTISHYCCCLCNIDGRVVSSFLCHCGNVQWWILVNLWILNQWIYYACISFGPNALTIVSKSTGLWFLLILLWVWIYLSHAYTLVFSDRLLSFVGITRTTMITLKYVDRTSQYTRSPLWKKIRPSGYRYDPFVSTLECFHSLKL